MTLPIAVLAGGLATRMRPLTDAIPKILIDLGGRSFGEHQLDLFRSQGIADVVLCLGYRGEQVVERLGDGSRWGLRITYVFDGPRLLGTGGAIRRALPHLGDAFFVIYGDSYLTCDFGAVESTFRRAQPGGALGLMTVFKNDNRWDKSNVALDAGRILRYEKNVDDPALQYIDYGLGILTPEAFAPFPAPPEGTDADGSAPLDLAAVYCRLIEQGALAGHEVHERFYEIGSAEGLADTRRLLESRERTVS